MNQLENVGSFKADIPFNFFFFEAWNVLLSGCVIVMLSNLFR